MMNEQRMNATQHGGSGPAVRSGHERRRRWFLKTLVALAVGVFAMGGTAHAQGGPGGGVVPYGDVVGTWMVIGDLTFPTVVTFTGANGQFTNGTFTWEETNPLTGVVTTVLGTYTVGLVPEGGLIGLTMVSQGEIVFQGIYAQPGPGEFIIETFAAWPLVGGPDFFSFFRQ